MKTLLLISFILMSLDSVGQIRSSKEWPVSIQREFNKIKKQRIDTFLVYYSYLGPWTSLPDSCQGISSVWILWVKENKHYARQLFCDSITNKEIQISSMPINYFVNHIKDFKLRDQYFKQNKFLPPIPTDGSWEYLILMTSKTSIYLNLSEDQRTNDIWKRFGWIGPTIKAIDTTRNELYDNKNER